MRFPRFGTLSLVGIGALIGIPVGALLGVAVWFIAGPDTATPGKTIAIEAAFGMVMGFLGGGLAAVSPRLSRSLALSVPSAGMTLQVLRWVGGDATLLKSVSMIGGYLTALAAYLVTARLRTLSGAAITLQSESAAQALSTIRT